MPAKRLLTRLTTLLAHPAARWTLFALAPVGYAIAILLSPLGQPGARAGFRIDRTEALARARGFLSQRGFDVEGWKLDVAARGDDELVEALDAIPAGEATRLSAEAPAVFFLVSFWRPAGDALVQVWLSPKGDVFRWLVSDPKGAGDATSAETDRAVAERALASRPDARTLVFERIDDEESGKLRLRRFLFTRAGAPLALEVSASVRGGRVVGESARVRSPARKGTTPGRAARKTIRMVAGIFYGVIGAALVFWGVVRWVIRFRDREVSHGRAFALGTAVFLCFLPMTLLGLHAAELEGGKAPSGRALELIAVVVMGGGLGTLCGLGWAGGEGDLRKLFPGRLASMDALLAGHLLSRNLGRSLLVGIAIGGWMACLSSLLFALAAASADPAPPMNNDLFVLGAAAPWLIGVSSGALSTLLWSLAGFVVALPVLARLLRGDARALLALGLAFAFTELPEFQGRGLVAAAAILLAGFVWSAGEITAFAAGDLACALAAASGFGLSRVAGLYLAQPNPGMRSGGFSILAILGGTALIAALATWRGREWSEADLLPSYARRIAENDDVRAQMSLARGAQERLRGRTPVEAAELELATEVVPASTVGGDYVDVFPRPGGGLLWVVADGGGKGAGAALSMTLARGLLLGLSRGSLDARRTVSRLRETLASELGDDSVPPFLIGIWEPVDGTVRLARPTGSFPKAAACRTGSDARPLALTSTEDGLDVAETTLAEGEGLLVWTDGAEAIPDVWGTALGQGRLLLSTRDAPPGARGLRDAVRHRLSRHAGGLGAGRLRDDVSFLAVVRRASGSSVGSAA